MKKGSTDAKMAQKTTQSGHKAVQYQARGAAVRGSTGGSNVAKRGSGASGRNRDAADTKRQEEVRGEVEGFKKLTVGRVIVAVVYVLTFTFLAMAFIAWLMITVVAGIRGLF